MVSIYKLIYEISCIISITVLYMPGKLTVFYICSIYIRKISPPLYNLFKSQLLAMIKTLLLLNVLSTRQKLIEFELNIPIHVSCLHSVA